MIHMVGRIPGSASAPSGPGALVTAPVTDQTVLQVEPASYTTVEGTFEAHAVTMTIPGGRMALVDRVQSEQAAEHLLLTLTVELAAAYDLDGVLTLTADGVEWLTVQDPSGSVSQFDPIED